MKKVIVSMFVASVLCLNLSLAKEIKLSGSTTVVSQIIMKIKDPFKKATGIDLVINGNGSGNGAKDLIKGLCDASMASESFADLKNNVKELAAFPDVKDYLLSKDVIKVIVNKDNGVTKLTKEQLKALNMGKIKNWKEVGGADSDVIVVTSQKNSGTASVFKKLALDNEAYSLDAHESANDLAVVTDVAAMPEAISAVSAGLVNDSVKTVDTPEIARPLILITKGEASADVKSLIAFIAKEGRAYLK